MYQVTLGTPEKFVPSMFKPASMETDTRPPQKFPLGLMQSKKTKRGFQIEFPLLESEEIYGFGLQMKGFACKHTKKLLRSNADPVANTGDSHAPVPFFVSTAGYGVCVDTLRNAAFYCGYRREPVTETEEQKIKSSTNELYATRKAQDTTQMLIDIPTAEGAALYIFEGETITDVVAEYNRFSGGGCMPALWGLGNTYRCYTGFSSDRVMEIADYMREKNLPCSCIGLEPAWQTHAYSCSYVPNKNLHPNFPGLVKGLREKGFAVNLWEHAFTNPAAPFFDEIKPYSGNVVVWNGLVPDFAAKEAKGIFARHHRDTLVKLGINAFKLDECDGSDYTGSWTYPDCTEFPSGLDGEQMHNAIGVLYQQTMLDALGENRGFNQVRSSGAFAASYPFALYSDLYDHKDFIRGMCTSGLSGLLWTPELREGKDGEDLIRRLQTVVFSAQSLINAWYVDGIPWEKQNCTDAARALLEMRMRLVPYLYSAYYRYHKTGVAPVRPLVSDYTGDRETYTLDTEYMLGDSLLIAPMTRGEHEREVYLPKGLWYDFWSGAAYKSGKHMVKTENIPVFVKDGTVLPLAEPEQTVGKETCFRLELRVYGTGGRCVLVEDDGETYAACKEIPVTAETTQVESFRYTVTKVTKIG